MKYLYHVTSPANLYSILTRGLSRDYGWAIYLCEDPKSWWVPGMEILRVRVSGLRGEFKTFGGIDEIMYLGDIPPKRIRRLVPPVRWYKDWHGEWSYSIPGPAPTKEKKAQELADYILRETIRKELEKPGR